MQENTERGGHRFFRAAHAPVGSLAVCPHCWNVNRYALRLCGRCGADMHLLLQESGGLRRTAAVQSPVPVRVSSRLSLKQRVLVLGFVIALVAAQILAAVFAGRTFPLEPAPPVQTE